MEKYYFITEEKIGNEVRVYVLDLDSDKHTDFECFYLENMAEREEEFFEKPLDMIRYSQTKGFLFL